MRWENDEKLENKDANVGIHGAGGLPDIGRGLSGRLLLQLQGQGVCQCTDRQSGPAGAKSGDGKLAGGAALCDSVGCFHFRRLCDRMGPSALPGLPENPLEADRPACGGAPADGRRADAAVGQYAGQCLPVVCLRYAGQ